MAPKTLPNRQVGPALEAWIDLGTRLNLKLADLGGPEGACRMRDNLVLELLRAIRGDIAKVTDRLDEHGHRLSRIGLMVAGQRRDQANDAEARAERDARFDRLRERLDRIERGLDIVPAG